MTQIYQFYHDSFFVVCTFIYCVFGYRTVKWCESTINFDHELAINRVCIIVQSSEHVVIFYN